MTVCSLLQKSNTTISAHMFRCPSLRPKSSTLLSMVPGPYFRNLPLPATIFQTLLHVGCGSSSCNTGSLTLVTLLAITMPDSLVVENAWSYKVASAKTTTPLVVNLCPQRFCAVLTSNGSWLLRQSSGARSLIGTVSLGSYLSSCGLSYLIIFFRTSVGEVIFGDPGGLRPRVILPQYEILLVLPVVSFSLPPSQQLFNRPQHVVITHLECQIFGNWLICSELTWFPRFK